MKDEVIALSSLLHTRSPSALQREVKPAVSQAADLVLGSPKRTTVLCVDNSSPRANALKALLEERGYQVWMAKDLADAVALLESLEFTALLLDPHRMWLGDEDLRLIKTIWPQLSVMTLDGAMLEPREKAQPKAQQRAVELAPADVVLSYAQALLDRQLSNQQG